MAIATQSYMNRIYHGYLQILSEEFPSLSGLYQALEIEGQDNLLKRIAKVAGWIIVGLISALFLALKMGWNYCSSLLTAVPVSENKNQEEPPLEEIPDERTSANGERPLSPPPSAPPLDENEEDESDDDALP